MKSLSSDELNSKQFRTVKCDIHLASIPFQIENAQFLLTNLNYLITRVDSLCNLAPDSLNMVLAVLDAEKNYNNVPRYKKARGDSILMPYEEAYNVPEKIRHLRKWMATETGSIIYILTQYELVNRNIVEVKHILPLCPSVFSWQYDNHHRHILTSKFLPNSMLVVKTDTTWKVTEARYQRMQ